MDEPIYTIKERAESPYATKASMGADPESLGKWLFSNGRIDGYRTKKERDAAVKAYALSQGADPRATLKAAYKARDGWIGDVKAKAGGKPAGAKPQSGQTLVQTMTGMAQPHLDKVWDRIAHSAIGNKRNEPKMGTQTRAGAKVTGPRSALSAAMPKPTPKPDRGMAMTLAGVGPKPKTDWGKAKDQTLRLGKNGVMMARDTPKGQWKRQKAPSVAVGMPNPSQGLTRKAAKGNGFASSIQPKTSGMKAKAIGGGGD